LRGYNARLDELQAAFLRVKLKYLDGQTISRRQIAEVYTTGLRNVIVPKVIDDANPVWHLYIIRTKEREKLRQRLNDLGVMTLIHYPIAPHLQPAYSELGYRKGDFPISELIHEEVLSLPMGPNLLKDEIDKVIESVAKSL
jgi:dTDP-4-amino-4,6-dideoxygalactose transaminase